MGIIKTVHLIYEYIRHDEEEKVAEVKRVYMCSPSFQAQISVTLST